MRALTLRQPNADHAVSGFKTVENRTRPTSYRGPVLIHAGQRATREGRDMLRGYVLGSVEIVGCHECASGDVEAEGTALAVNCCPTSSGALSHRQYAALGYARDMPARLFHWELTDAKPFRHPIQWGSGREGLWTPPVDLLSLVQAEVTPLLDVPPVV